MWLWDLNSGPLKEQLVLLTAEPSLQPKPSPLYFLFVFKQFLFICLFFVFQDRVSLYIPGCPGTHFGDQAGLELRNPPASASQVLGSKACATISFNCGANSPILNRSFKNFLKSKGRVKMSMLFIVFICLLF